MFARSALGYGGTARSVRSRSVHRALCFALLACCSVGCQHVETSRHVANKRGDPISKTDPLASNRVWEVLEPVGRGDQASRSAFSQAADQFGTFEIHFSGIVVDAKRLRTIAEASPGEPFTRVVRENLGRPIDVEDFAFYLDDVLRHRNAGYPKRTVFLSNHRARKAGITIHPDDVFFNRPRLYGTRPVDVYHPIRPAEITTPAKPGDSLGPNWHALYRNPSATRKQLAAITMKAPTSTYAARLKSLIDQIKQQKGEVYLNSTVRDPRRGYLMWGAFELANTTSEEGVESTAAMLDNRNRDWSLEVDIRWRHPNGWRATVAAAKEMAERYDVVFATEQGAKNSNHYGARAADLTILNLPRKLTLRAPDGAVETFDLSAPDNPRDMNLDPNLIEWIEKHFQMKKLLGDYPHWDDVARQSNARPSRAQYHHLEMQHTPRGPYIPASRHLHASRPVR
ncbi:MAG: hypothetical protein ACKVK6_09760 [bacterium]